MSGPFGSQQFMYKAGAKGAVDLLEEDADSDTFVCEFTGTGNETGAGAGLSGSNLILTEAGTVSDASDGWRTLNDGAFRPTQAWIDHFFASNSGNERTLAMHLKNITVDATTAGETNGLFNWVGSPATGAWYLYIPNSGGSANKLKITNMTGNAYVGIGNNDSWYSDSLFASDAEIWICWWQDGTYDRVGWVEGSDAPSKWSDFDSGKRTSASFNGAYASGVTSAANYGFGINNGNIVGRFDINRVVMSLSGSLIEND